MVHFLLVVGVNVFFTDCLFMFVQALSDIGLQHNQSHSEDAELAEAVSLPLKVCCAVLCSDHIFLL